MKTNNSQIEHSAELDRASEVFKTIAHPTRLIILLLLHEKNKMNVSHIKEALGCDCEQSMLSHHLNKMKDKDLLQSEKQGKFIFYSIKDDCIEPILNCLHKIQSQ